MRVYRVHYHTENGISAGYSFHSSLASAIAERAAAIHETPDEVEPEIDVIEFRATKAGILKLLNRYASHAENG